MGNKCQGCGDEIPNRMLIDGKVRILNKRKYCISCSPFGSHNTKKLNGKPRADQLPYGCSCGETDPKKFYGHKRTVCGECHNEYCKRTGKEKRQRAINELGGKCCLCGYDKYYGAMALHHLDPSAKDKTFDSLRSWSWKRIAKEIKNCVVLCHTCHSEVHAGISKVPDKQGIVQCGSSQRVSSDITRGVTGGS